MFLVQASSIEAIIDGSKRSLREYKRLREIENHLSTIDAYEAACSVTLVWPFKADTFKKIETLRYIVWLEN